VLAGAKRERCVPANEPSCSRFWWLQSRDRAFGGDWGTSTSSRRGPNGQRVEQIGVELMANSSRSATGFSQLCDWCTGAMSGSILASVRRELPGKCHGAVGRIVGVLKTRPIRKWPADGAADVMADRMRSNPAPVARGSNETPATGHTPDPRAPWSLINDAAVEPPDRTHSHNVESKIRRGRL